ncbi:MAG: hypothetical protein H6Q74_1824 [Firmicutes bacterium]|nr:hypothetical protein [Bacillota bacterium]
MKINNKCVIGLVAGLLVALSTSLCFAGQYVPRKLTSEQMAQRALDYQEIENVMSKHEYYHSLKLNKDEIDTIWCKKAPNPSFGQNQGFFVGYKLLYETYRNGCEIMTNEATEKMKKMYPELAGKSDQEIYGVGSMIFHTTTTPIIEVAGDGKTAKGLWYSPGQVTEVGPDGPSGQWIWEKYAVDFVKEDGQWKIWHMLVVTDLVVDVGKSWTDKSYQAPMFSAGGKDKDGNDMTPPKRDGFQLPGPNYPGVNYQVYSKTRVPMDYPRMPEPYYTFSETFSYGVEGVPEQ